jgi:hypothetical protein
MLKFALIIWMLVGIAIITYGIHKKKEYRYIDRFTMSTTVIMIISVIIWPLTLVNTMQLIKREEQIINEVTKKSPKYTRDMIIEGAKIWRKVAGQPAGSRSRRYVPAIWGVVYVATALFFYLRTESWRTPIVGGILFVLGWVSLKTALFASSKEISELTSPGPISEDTKRKFQDRI